MPSAVAGFVEVLRTGSVPDKDWQRAFFGRQLYRRDKAGVAREADG